MIDKKDVVHAHNGILLSQKKEGSLAICNNMDGPRGYYTKWNKSDGKRLIPLRYHLYVEYKKTRQRYKQNRNRLINTEQTGGYHSVTTGG